MDILRNIAAGSSISSVDVETIYGVPVRLSVDLRRPGDSWRIEPFPSPSTELKLKAGIYNNPAHMDLMRVSGKELEYFEFRTRVCVSDSRYGDYERGFWDIDEDCWGRLKSWFRYILEHGRAFIDANVCRELALQKGTVPYPEVEKALGPGARKAIWLKYDTLELFQSVYKDLPHLTEMDLHYVLDYALRGTYHLKISEQALEYLKKCWKR